MSCIDVRRRSHCRMNRSVEPTRIATRTTAEPSPCAHPDAAAAISQIQAYHRGSNQPILRHDFSTLRQLWRTTGRSDAKTQLVWMVGLGVLCVPSMVSALRLPRGPDQARSRDMLPRGLLRALPEGTRQESSISKKCRNDVVLATASLPVVPAMTHWPWRRSDRTFRTRDLDLHRTLSGRLRRCSRGAAPRPRVRARRRAVGP